jgi:hypothetical protein
MFQWPTLAHIGPLWPCSFFTGPKKAKEGQRRPNTIMAFLELTIRLYHCRQLPIPRLAVTVYLNIQVLPRPQRGQV